MKKIALLSITVLTLIACKKESTCTCTQVYTEPAYMDNNSVYHQQYTYITQSTNTLKTKKKDATSTCKKGESIKSTPTSKPNQGPSTTVVTCEVI